MSRKGKAKRLEEMLSISQRAGRVSAPVPGADWQERVMQEVRATDMLEPSEETVRETRLWWYAVCAAAAVALVVGSFGFSEYAGMGLDAAWFCLEDSIGVTQLFVSI